MKLFNVITDKEQENSCFQFNHKGWVVSYSNLFAGGSLMAFKDGEPDLIADTIPEILQMIDMKKD